MKCGNFRWLIVSSEVAEMTKRVAAGDYKARVPVRGGDEVAGLAAAFNRMADSLEQVENLRKSLVADVAHELRTPLTSVRGYLEALADGMLPPEKSTFDMLQNEVQRLAKLSGDLLQLARADAARAYPPSFSAKFSAIRVSGRLMSHLRFG
jgi:signal transduction histidine kinase